MVREIREETATKRLPVIFLTAKDTPSDIIEGIKVGAKHYLTKPFRVPDLVEKVRTVLPRPPE